MQVKEIMSKGIIKLSPDDRISKFISLMEKHNIHEILVTENEKLIGIIYSEDLTKRGILDPSKTKINAIINFPPPIVSPDQDVKDAADLIFKTGLRAIPVCKKDKLVGIISIKDIVRTISKTKEFKQITAEKIITPPEIISQDTDIGKARVIMRERNISKLPVVDKENKLVGIVTLFDLAKAIKPRERMSWYSMGAEMDRIMGIPVSTIMNSNPVTADKKKTLNQIANLMTKFKVTGIVITENKIPIGIITPKDLLEIYISGFKAKGIYYQIVGLTDEDDFIVDTIDRMIRDSVQRLSYVYKPKFFFLHLKKHDKGGRIKYSVRVRFNTSKGTFISKAYAWDLRDAVDEALERLERMILKEKRTIKDKLRRTKIRLKKILK
ncbi:MAG: CBS domain-containing protein [Candidatus Aenigmatarchaeota archaeon]